jgi:tRNA A-37 threonylcarbamoyl transferase component Bud32
MFEPGAIVGGRYRLDAVIGRGGMASVYRAWDMRLARAVAVKLLRPEILADADLALRFRREAHAATVLRHPNVVACLDTGTEGESPYLVMELVEGEDLAARLKRESPLPARQAVAIAADVARGLAIAHARGIVHRDVKPGNILLAVDGRAMVTDFGVARLAAEAEATIPGTTLGSVHYFSPEQARGATTTAASDVYSLGLVLFEMLTGTRPFGGDSPAAIALARVDAPAPSARAVDPTLPPALEQVLHRALDQDPARRYPNGGALATALDVLLAPAIPAAGPGDPTSRVPVPVREVERPARSPVAAPLVGVVAAVLVVVGIFGGLAMLGAAGRGVAALDTTATPRGGTTAPTAQPVATPDPATPQPATPAPATPRPAPDGPADLCEPGDDAACPLDPGTYRPSRFVPSFSIELDDGWRAFRHTAELVVFERSTGYLTLASRVSVVYEGQDEFAVESTQRGLIDAFRDNGAIEVLDQRRVRVAGERAIQLDLVPSGDERTPLFAAGDDRYFAETTTVTRLLAFEVDGVAVLLLLEGAGEVDLRGLLEFAAPALESLAFG